MGHEIKCVDKCGTVVGSIKLRAALLLEFPVVMAAFKADPKWKGFPETAELLSLAKKKDYGGFVAKAFPIQRILIELTKADPKGDAAKKLITFKPVCKIANDLIHAKDEYKGDAHYGFLCAKCDKARKRTAAIEAAAEEVSFGLMAKALGVTAEDLKATLSRTHGH